MKTKTKVVKLTEKQKERMAVCRDVLKWITPDNIKDRNGYVMNRSETPTSELVKGANRTVAKRLQKNCKMCAKGALFLSVIYLRNEFQFDTERDFFCYENGGFSGVLCGLDLDSEKMMSRLAKIFPRKNLDAVEMAFESIPGGYDYDDSARKFGAAYDTPTDRLRAIIENMLEHKGTFVPEAGSIKEAA